MMERRSFLGWLGSLCGWMVWWNPVKASASIPVDPNIYLNGVAAPIGTDVQISFYGEDCAFVRPSQIIDRDVLSVRYGNVTVVEARRYVSSEFFRVNDAGPVTLIGGIPVPTSTTAVTIRTGVEAVGNSIKTVRSESWFVNTRISFEEYQKIKSESQDGGVDLQCGGLSLRSSDCDCGTDCVMCDWYKGVANFMFSGVTKHGLREHILGAA